MILGVIETKKNKKKKKKKKQEKKKGRIEVFFLI